MKERMNERIINELIAEWDEVYKKGQLSFWLLLSIYDSKKYAAEMTEFMYTATNGTFEVKEQSLYRALRRFKAMGMVTVSEEDSPNGGPKRKFYALTPIGQEVLRRFTELHVVPLYNDRTISLINQLRKDA